MYLKHIKGTGKWYLIEQIKTHVDPVARLITDELAAYKNLPKHGYILHDGLITQKRMSLEISIPTISRMFGLLSNEEFNLRVL